MGCAIMGGRIIDPTQKIDVVTNLFIEEGKIASFGQPPLNFVSESIIDAHNKIVCPGFIDLSAKLYTRNLIDKTLISNEVSAALKSGITTLVCQCGITEPAVIESIKNCTSLSGTKVLTLGALTCDRDTRLTEMATFKDLGCIGVSDSGNPITNTLVLKRALEYAANFDLRIFLTPIDNYLFGGVAHEGLWATLMGLKTVSIAAETSAIAHNLELIRAIGNVKVHFGRLSCARSVELIDRAQSEGLSVTADVAMHNLHLTEQNLEGFNSYCHVQPPLRSFSDRQALRDGVSSGVISAICSDHQPQACDCKQAPFSETVPGISSLETLLPLGLQLAEEDNIDLSIILERMTSGPAKILGINRGHLQLGSVADICIFDPIQCWVLTKDKIYSYGKNSPFIGWQFKGGQVINTMLNGCIAYKGKVT